MDRRRILKNMKARIIKNREWKYFYKKEERHVFRVRGLRAESKYLHVEDEKWRREDFGRHNPTERLITARWCQISEEEITQLSSIFKNKQNSKPIPIWDDIAYYTKVCLPIYNRPKVEFKDIPIETFQYMAEDIGKYKK
jgi:hypothetical protein